MKPSRNCRSVYQSDNFCTFLVIGYGGNCNFCGKINLNLVLQQLTIKHWRLSVSALGILRLEGDSHFE